MFNRELNVDLFRVIATFFVIVLHVLGQGGILNSASPNGATYWAAWFFEIGTYCAVNCFALISGYVMANKSVKPKRIIGLWFQTAFYSVLFTVLFFAFIPESRTIKNLLVAFLPIVGRQWWYVSSYFALFFFIPFLNAAINHISQQAYKKFLIIVLIGVCGIACVVPQNAFALDGGYSVIWLIICYLFGAYIKKYDALQKITARKGMIGFLAMIILTFFSKIIIRFLTTRIFGQAKIDDLLISYVSITILLSAIFLFAFCLNVKVGNFASKLIGFLSPVTLGIYLIHVHPLVFNYIIKDAFVSFAQKPFIVMILYVLVVTLIIFVICTIIELLRIQLFKVIKVGKLCEIVAKKFNDFYLRFFETKKG